MEEPNSTQEIANIQLPKALEDLPIAKCLCSSKQTWNSNEEIASILIAFEKHKDWKQLEIKIRPASGSMLLYSRNKVRYRKDGYCWKKRKDGKTIREDHMKLKVQGVECIYGSYVHSAVLPTFHRRCYWLLQNPDIVLVHYLNVPYTDNSKLTIPTLSYYMEKKEWSKEELVDQLRPMFCTGREPNQENKDSVEETIAMIVKQLLDHQDKHFQSKLHKCDTTCDKSCALRGITPKRETTQPGSEVNSRLIGLLERSHSSQSLNAQQISSNASSIIMAPNSAQPVTTVTTLNDQGSASGTPLILNLSNFAGSNGIIILSGQTNTPISIINSTQTQEPPVNVRSTHLPTVIKSTEVLYGKESATSNIPMQISSGSDEFASGLVNSNKENSGNLFSASDFSLSQSVLQNGFPADLSNLPVTNVDTSGISSTNCDMFKSDLSFPTPSDLSLDNLDLLDFADIDKLCPGWSDTCSDVASDSIPQSSFNLVDKPMSILNGSSCQGNPAQPSHQLNCQQQIESNNCQSHIPHHVLHDVQTSPSSRLPLSQTQLSSLNPGKAAPLYTQTHISPLLHDTPSQLHCSHHLLTHEQQHPAHLHDNGKPVSLPSIHSDLNKDQLEMSKIKKEDSVGHISDFSPDWSYTEGGTKVLVTGPWLTSSDNYACVFDNKSIAATLVQPGVLRCFTPEHAAGLVTLHVTLDDCVISNFVVFEYKTTERREATPTHGDWFSVDESQLQLMLLERLAQLEERLASNSINKDTPEPSQSEKPSDREGQLIRFCQLLSQRQWLSVESLPKLTAYGTRLLHLAAGLGYDKLIQQLIKWRSADTSAILDSEIDAHSLDNFSSTPLMWACARGHLESALCLYNWSNAPMKLCNKDGLFPLNVARRNGHHTIADHLEMLEQDTVMLTDQSQFGLGSSITDLNSFLLDNAQIKGNNSIPSSCKPVITSNNRETLLNYCPPPERVADPSTLTSLHIDIPTCTQAQYQTNSQLGSKLARRFSEQTCASVLRRRLSKRFSMEVFPDSTLTNYCSNPAPQSLRIANSEPDLGANIEGLARGDNPMISEHCHEVTSPEDLLLQAESLLGIHRLHDDVFSISRGFHPITSQHTSTNNQVVAMDTDDISSVRSDSPFIDVEKVSSDDDELHNLVQQAANLAESSGAEGQHRMVTLANQIIAAMPERIKSSPSRCDEGVVTECQRGRSESHSSVASQNSPPPSSYGDDSGISTPLGEGLSFEDFRYRDIDTPASSLSPDSTSLPSPYSPYTFHLDSPPPTTAEFNEYFNAPATYMEKDFSQLTLSDHEQRKLYEAAKLIQNAFRIYRDKQQQQQQLQKEIEAAILIQSYYRRYKQYMYYKKMTQAAVLIQSQFRSYSAQKRYKKSRDAAVVIQNQYRTYKQHERFKKSRNAAVIIQQRFRNHYQRKQSQEMASNLLQMASESNDNSPVHDANTTISDATTSVDTEPKKTAMISGDTPKKKDPLLKRSSSVGKSKMSLRIDPDLERPVVNANKQKSSNCMGDNSDSTTPARRASSLSKT